jgi:hypothetical protein
MEPFKDGGKTLEVWTQSGTVLSTSKHSKTDIASYGGGGWVGQHGGSVSAPTIVSSTTTEQEIWIRRDNGEETAIKLVNVEVPVREGQRVTFIAAKNPQAKDGFWVTLVNHSANRYWRLTTNVEASKRGKLGAYPLVRWYDFLVAFLIGKLMFPVVLPFLAFLTPPDDGHGNKGVPWAGLFVLFGPPILYPVLRCLLRIRRKSRIFAALNAWAERNAEETLRVGGVSGVGTVPAARAEKVA